MKISFSTLGCPGWSWEEILATAKDLGFDGIEVRGIENELYVPRAKPFLTNSVDSTLERMKRLNLLIPCLTSNCCLFDKENAETNFNEGKDFIDLAAKLHVPYVRVLGDRNPQPDKGIDMDFVAAALSRLASYAEGENVTVLVETNGALADSDKILYLLKCIKNKNVGVLWDVHHPYRFFGENPGKTYDTLREYIKFVHIKDSVVENGQIKYKMMGKGDVPVREALDILLAGGYTDFVSLEWVKRWYLELEEPGVVFSHFANFMKSYR